MRMRRVLFQMTAEICARDHLDASDIARICGTSRNRGHMLLTGRIELFNSETLVDILWRLGVDIEVVVTGRVPYLRYIIAKPRPNWKPLPNARGSEEVLTHRSTSNEVLG
jgi:predicted XRE-type DNA-binding protein